MSSNAVQCLFCSQHFSQAKHAQSIVTIYLAEYFPIAIQHYMYHMFTSANEFTVPKFPISQLEVKPCLVTL